MNLDASISTIMTKSITCVTPDHKILELKHIYEQPSFHSHVPVTQDDKLVGVVSLIDFMRAIHNASLDENEVVYHEVKVRDIMTKNPVTVEPTESIKNVASLLSDGNFHSILVASNGKVEGIVTTTDILKELLAS